jgi:pilus assembly protein CpaB
MRLRNLILLLLAVMLAGGTAFLARSYLAAQRAEQVIHAAAPTPQPARSILVARGDLERGHIITPSDFGWQVWPDSAMRSAYIESGGKFVPQDFAGWVVVDPIAEGAPVTQSTMISPGSGGFLAAVLRPGMRAIQVPTQSMPPAGTQPGDRVDMMVSFSFTPPVPAVAKGYDGSKNVVETVLRGLRILQIGNQLETSKPTGTPPATASGPLIFEVTPRQAEIVTLAETMGSISFTLDSLRHGPVETAASGGGVVLAAVHEPQSDPRDPPAGASMSAPAAANGASSDMTDAEQPTYLNDAAVNRYFQTTGVDASVTVLRGGQLQQPADITVHLQCGETGCAEFSPEPTRLVGTGDLAEGK